MGCCQATKDNFTAFISLWQDLFPAPWFSCLAANGSAEHALGMYTAVAEFDSAPARKKEGPLEAILFMVLAGSDVTLQHRAAD